MVENKTRATGARVADFLNLLGQGCRVDANAMVKIMHEVSRQKPKMWGAYRLSASAAITTSTKVGAKATWPLICFSPRRGAMVVYNMGSADKTLLNRLSKHKLSGSCLHIKKLADIDSDVLKALISKSFTRMQVQDRS